MQQQNHCDKLARGGGWGGGGGWPRVGGAGLGAPYQTVSFAGAA